MCNIFELINDVNNWRDFIWPSIITVITILASIWFAKREFEKKQKLENLKLESDKKQLRNLILRNIKRVTDQLIIDEPRFLEAYVNNYDIEKGIVPTQVLFSFKELEILNAIDVLRFESAFTENEKTEEQFNDLYLTFSAMSMLWDSYNKIASEVMNINTFLSDYDTVLLEKYMMVTSYVEKNIIEYVERNGEKETLSLDDFKELLSILNAYKSNINNFHELHTIIDNLNGSDIFKQIIEGNYFDFNERKSSFLVYYLKYRQEVLLFHNRIRHLIRRIEKNRIQLEKFHSSFIES